ncbi:type II toxin-antitoxin system VapC family toxin [Moraxella oblonga]|uniref:type II toxin-antitoxin system VapC family toxin n=1 Tax=Moraxella oblonga TaxID=200413 RepID=UPI00082D1385|nr:type II toxin-antitoxin system VapC family toxin [Moraxella oblonga]
MYLYDNNYISELVKRDKNPNVVAFFNYVQANQLKGYLSIITIGEIEFGIEKLNNRNDFLQAQRLRNWYNNNLPLIAERSLVFDEQCAKVWGNLMAKNPHNPIDKQLCATAIVFDLVLVTRNVKHIEDTGVKYINPFEFQPLS